MISLISLLGEFLSRLVSCASGSLVGGWRWVIGTEVVLVTGGGVNDGFGGLGGWGYIWLSGLW